MSSRVFLLTGWCLLTFVSGGLADPISIPNGDWSERDGSGYPAQWVRREWSTGSSIPAEMKAAEENGKVWLNIPAQMTGGVGCESSLVPIAVLKKGFTIKCEMKATADYTNRPWVFVAWYNQGTFLTSTFVKAIKPPDDTSTPETWAFSPEIIPPAATGMTVVLATIADSKAAAATGTISYSSLSLSDQP